MFPRHLYALLFALLAESPTSYAFGSLQQSFLGTSPVKSGQVKSVLEREPVKVPACRQFVRRYRCPVISCSTYLVSFMQPTGPIETTECDFETMESVTETLYDELHSLVDTPFFKYFRVCVLSRRRFSTMHPG